MTGLPVSGSWQDLKDHMREVWFFTNTQGCRPKGLFSFIFMTFNSFRGLSSVTFLTCFSSIYFNLFKKAGDVVYADVYRDGTGVVEFSRREDMKYALKKLDDTKFKSHEVSPFLDFNYKIVIIG